jgi:hypothetical protein
MRLAPSATPARISCTDRHSFNTDLGLVKNTAITERTRIQFRAEFFDLFNNVHFGQPGSVFGQPSFGKITSAGEPRILQLTLKFLS